MIRYLCILYFDQRNCSFMFPFKIKLHSGNYHMTTDEDEVEDDDDDDGIFQMLLVLNNRVSIVDSC